MYYRLDGKKAMPCRLEDFSADVFPGDNKVALDYFGDVMVSTVFLCFDHNFTKPGPPLLFETMVFGGHYTRNISRYTTWEEAEAGHKATCDLVEASIENDKINPGGFWGFMRSIFK